LIPKLSSLLKIRGAENIREILVGSDRSTDDIATAIAELGDSRIKLMEFPQRRGKASVLNDLMPQSTGDVVMMTDARQVLNEDAMDSLLAPFADETVGVVSGNLVFRKNDEDGTGTKGLGSYWNYEKMIRRAESVCNPPVAAAPDFTRDHFGRCEHPDAGGRTRTALYF
jgi:glycosyltransferase involved in cell wall biosynthesis